MKILRIDSRHFLIESGRDAGDAALKILNEHRRMNTVPSNAQAIVEQVCDEMDGETAVMLVRQIHDVAFITPEVL